MCLYKNNTTTIQDCGQIYCCHDLTIKLQAAAYISIYSFSTYCQKEHFCPGYHCWGITCTHRASRQGSSPHCISLRAAINCLHV